MSDYWKTRATKYAKLAWVNNKDVLKSLEKFCKLKKTDRLLEVGCGNGVVAVALSKKVKEVWASDRSPHMLGLFPKGTDIKLLVSDVEKDITINNYFNTVVARMLFHHLTDFNSAFFNCKSMLVKGGSLVLQEGGVLPEKEKEVATWYADMMALKEDRHNFTVEELIHLFKKAGFKKVTTLTLVDKNFSINNWLENSGQSKKLQKKIYDMHKNAPYNIRKFYNMRMIGKEIFINSSTVLIKGTK
jgi:ubiquinone/menaquinone biosynthesis C-methylase UbiE